MAMAGSAGGRITAGVGANLIGMHASDRNQDATVYVGNLDPQASEELVWELFVQAGPVVNVYLPKDRVTNAHQGYGFVEFRSEEDADYSIKILNMVKIYGKPIRVNKASQDKNSQDVGANLFIGNLDPDVDEKLLYDTFSAFGVIVNTPKIMRDPESGASKGFGFISFDGFEASDAAIEAMNGQFLMNRAITVSYAFKKDTKGERHGTPAERLLAAQKKAKQVASSRPNTLFATGPRQKPQAEGGEGQAAAAAAAMGASGFAAGAPMPPPPVMPAPGMGGPLPGMAPPPWAGMPPAHMGGSGPPPWGAPPPMQQPPMQQPWATGGAPASGPPASSQPLPPPGGYGSMPPGMPPPPPRQMGGGFPPPPPPQFGMQSSGMPPPPPGFQGGFPGGAPPPPRPGMGGPPPPPPSMGNFRSPPPPGMLPPGSQAMRPPQGQTPPQPPNLTPPPPPGMAPPPPPPPPM